jgi:hypothetical protein
MKQKFVFKMQSENFVIIIDAEFIQIIYIPY